MLFGGLFADWCARRADAPSIELLSLPDEILEKIPLVLGQQQVLGLLDGLSELHNELSAFA
jgi:hypothetical protein